MMRYPNQIKEVVLTMFLMGFVSVSQAQSFEFMPGHERIFIDAQFLNFMDAKKRVSLFSRARATTTYTDQTTDLFTGAYVNYTTKRGVGATLVGRIGSRAAGTDLGIHYFKARKSFMVYALPSVNLGDQLLYSWFSILRFTPELKGDWKGYSSLELFSAFGEVGHLSSVQRIRLGADRAGYQFGAAINLAERPGQNADINAGVFLRKQFR